MKWRKGREEYFSIEKARMDCYDEVIVKLVIKMEREEKKASLKLKNRRQNDNEKICM